MMFFIFVGCRAYHRKKLFPTLVDLQFPEYARGRPKPVSLLNYINMYIYFSCFVTLHISKKHISSFDEMLMRIISVFTRIRLE